MRQTTTRNAIALLSFIFCFAFAQPLQAIETNGVNDIKTETQEEILIFGSIEDYIENYKDMAISEMHRAKIPASIKLAQGIIESNFGNSYLARSGNNHFGIKCHKSWTGKAVFRDDDAKNECFRSYPSDYDSYVDHSKFLSRSRYDDLFRLDISDYKGWAKGLLKAGYATNPKYSEQIIRIVEQYELYRYDIDADMVASNSKSILGRSAKSNTTKTKTPKLSSHKKMSDDSIEYVSSKKLKRSEVFYYNRLKTVVINTPATPTQIAQTYDISLYRLCKYNGFKENQLVPANTKIYLQAKRNKGPKHVEKHVVKIGETMTDISQHYGIKEDKLYNRNLLNKGMQPAPGEIVYLRKDAPRPPKLMSDYQMEQTNQAQRSRSKELDKSSKEQSRKIPNKTETTYTTTTNTTTTTKSQIPTELRKGVNESIEKTETTTYKQKTPMPSKADRVIPNERSTSTTRTYESPSTTTTATSSSTYFDEAKTTRTKTYEKPARPNTSSGSTYFDNASTTILDRGNAATKTTKTYTAESSTTTASPKVVRTASEINTNTTTKYNTSTTKHSITEPSSSTHNTYTIQPKDTLYSLSKKFGTTVEKLKELNGLTSNDIKIGQKLQVPIN